MRDWRVRAGGQWTRPWSSIDHVRSWVMSARHTLLRGVPQDAYALFTEDEAELIQALNTALMAIERITRDDAQA